MHHRQGLEGRGGSSRPGTRARGERAQPADPLLPTGRVKGRADSVPLLGRWVGSGRQLLGDSEWRGRGGPGEGPPSSFRIALIHPQSSARTAISKSCRQVWSRPECVRLWKHGSVDRQNPMTSHFLQSKASSYPCLCLFVCHKPCCIDQLQQILFKWQFRRTEAVSSSYTSGMFYSVEKNLKIYRRIQGTNT